MSSGLHWLSHGLDLAFRPDIMATLSLTSQHVGRVFRGSAVGTLVILLALPFHQCGANTTVGRCMLRNPPPVAGFQGGHSFQACFPIDGIFGFKRETSVAHPLHLGESVHDEPMQSGTAGVCDYGGPMPQGPAFIVNGKVGGFQSGKMVEQKCQTLFG